jgi:ABC-type lipoprotein export system ATPase subunit
MSNSFIECRSLSKQYKSKRQTINAVTDINLQVQRNEMIILKGRSGAGKSTLLNLICGLISPTSGTIRIGDKMINELDDKSLSNLLLTQIGIIFQSFNLLPTYNIYENIEVALAPKGLGHKDIQKLVLPYLEQFQLTDKLHLLPEELSVGQQQKVAIIRTLVKQPSIILADEPTGSVDDETAREILEYLRYLREEKKVTIILATHGIIPDTFADRVFTIENGRINN